MVACSCRAANEVLIHVADDLDGQVLERVARPEDSLGSLGARLDEVGYLPQLLRRQPLHGARAREDVTVEALAEVGEEPVDGAGITAREDVEERARPR